MINNTDQNFMNLSGWLKKHQELNDRLAQNVKPELFKRGQGADVSAPNKQIQDLSLYRRGGKVKKRKTKRTRKQKKIEIGLPPNPMQRPFYPITFGATGYSGPAVTNQPASLYEELKKAQQSHDELFKKKQEDYDRQIANLTQQIEDLQSAKPFKSVLDMGASSSMSSSSSGINNEIPDVPAQLEQHRAAGAAAADDKEEVDDEFNLLDQNITQYDIFVNNGKLYIIRNGKYVRWYPSQLSEKQKNRWRREMGPI